MLLQWALLIANLVFIMLNYEEELVGTATEIWEPNNENPDFYDKIASFEGTARVSTQDQNYYVDSSGQNPIARFRRFDYDK